MNTTRRILGVLCALPRKLALAFGLTGLACGLNLLVPVLIQNLIDHMVAGDAARPRRPWACSRRSPVRRRLHWQSLM